MGAALFPASSPRTTSELGRAAGARQDITLRTATNVRRFITNGGLPPNGCLEALRPNEHPTGEAE